MTALQETAKQIAQLESDMAKQRNALREIRSRVDRAMAEPDIRERIRRVYYGKSFEQLDCSPRHGWSMKDGEPELRIPQMGEWYLSAVSRKPGKCIAPMTHSPRLILTPVEPERIVYVKDSEGWFAETLTGGMTVAVYPENPRYRREEAG